MKPYHEAWLAAHPWRTRKWLIKRFLDGFDIHHIDGNKQNNDPSNLVLTEHTDHMHLHGMPLRQYARRANKLPKPKYPSKAMVRKRMRFVRSFIRKTGYCPTFNDAEY